MGMASTRRGFLKTTGAGLASAALLASPARALAGVGRGSAHLSVPLDHDWLFGGEAVPGSALPGFDDSAFERVTLPHSNARMSWHDIRPADFRGEYAGDHAPYEFISIYRRHFPLPDDARGRRAFVEFDGAMAASAVTINGTSLGEHRGGYTPFSFELTDHLERDNVLAVEIDSRRTRADVPPFGGRFGDDPDLVQVDFDTFGGLHRGTRLKLVPPTFVANVFAKPVDVLGPGRRLDVRCFLDGARSTPLVVEVELRDGDRLIRRASADATDAMVDVALDGLSGVELWDVEHPRLYDVRVRLRERGGRPVHEYRTRVGFRDARFTPEGFFLNGERLKLRGLNRHQIFPYVGNAMPARVQRRDAEILRHELNCNMIRSSHYPPSPDFLDACDELGLLVWDEIAGWHFVGDQEWQDVAAENAEAMIRRDWNHPSVVLWAVRVNESPATFGAFEARLNDLAHALDDSRQTSGAYNGGQPQRQDVRGQNDYADDYAKPLAPPRYPLYLVTEAVGQKRPGGAFDQTYLRTDPAADQQAQAYRHARVHDAAASDDRYAGALAWCAFEYLSTRNSIRDIKTPGVCDIFRIPKPGASFYRSQVDPARRVILEPAFYWDFGDRTPAGPGAEALVCSNCERLEVYLDGEHLSSALPARDVFPHLPYAPFLVDLTLPAGARPELRIDGFVGERRVISRPFSPDPAHDRLEVVADDERIAGDGIDATRVVFRAVDRYGAPRPFVTGDVTIALRGPGELIGDKRFDFAAAGGAGAVWVRGRAGGAGRVLLTAEHATLGTGRASLRIGRA
jgi:beta-galactosidase